MSSAQVETDVSHNSNRTIQSLLAEADRTEAVLRRIRDEAVTEKLQTDQTDSEDRPIERFSTLNTNTWTMARDDVELHPMTTSDIIKQLQSKYVNSPARYSRLREFDDEHTITIPYECYVDESDQLASRRHCVDKVFRYCSACFVGTVVCSTVAYLVASCIKSA